MYARFFMAIIVIAFAVTRAEAAGSLSVPFVDGRWHGGINSGSGSSDFEECWASTTFGDGTTLTLAEREDGKWRLLLSNRSWTLQTSRRYDMVAQVDFYPRRRFVAEARSEALMEIADLDGISLLGLIENGHTIDLRADGFNKKYDLEGSAKIIEKIRNCFADQKRGKTTGMTGN
jgi:hypothetical protein